MSKVKGTKINSKIAFLKEGYSEAVVARVFDSLTPEDRTSMCSLVDLGWYDMDLYEKILDAIVEVAAKGNDQILERMGRYGAEDLSQHAYKVYYRSKDPETVLQKMIPIHSALNDPAEMEVVKRRDRQLSVIVKEPPSTLHHCRVATAFYQRSVELCGVSRAAVEEVRCSAKGDSHCEFVVSWQ